VSRFVLDASIVLTWCFPDEASQKAEEISERIASGDRIVVSAFWRYEVLNALLVGERRKRITPALTQAFLDDLDRLPVDVDVSPSSARVFTATQSLCRKHGLTAYDAAYLEIALRGTKKLATVDDDLKRAAVAEGVQVLLQSGDRPVWA
jgi:predicted nucleic acid-binding protein